MVITSDMQLTFWTAVRDRYPDGILSPCVKSSVRPKQDFSCFGQNRISAKLEMPIFGRNRYSADTTYFGRKKLISAKIMCFGSNMLFRPELSTVSADITANMYRQKHGYFD